MSSKTYDLSAVHGADLAILKEIDRICRKYKIQYLMDAGTLLGAVRHKGFIPWDDDADVAFTRENYEKFKTVVRDELPEGMEFLEPDQMQGGKAFLIIHFTSEQKFYYLHIRQLLRFWNRAQEGGRKSFRMDELDPAYFFESSKGYLVPFLEPLSMDLEQEQER